MAGSYYFTNNASKNNRRTGKEIFYLKLEEQVIAEFTTSKLEIKCIYAFVKDDTES